MVRVKKSILGLGRLVLLFLMVANCHPPRQSGFNHRQTLFPLRGAHSTIDCRECHKDGSLTSLPTACVSCHPQSADHTKNLGDCELCHTQTTFASAFFNHRRAGVPMGGAHLMLVAGGCRKCHTNSATYRIAGGFTCSNCHTPVPVVSGPVDHSLTAPCQQCHNQYSFTPAAYRSHPTTVRLIGAHAGMSCGSCHTAKFTSWAAVNYRDGGDVSSKSCASCHTRDYDWGEGDHNGLPADNNCGRCHGYSNFDD